MRKLIIAFLAFVFFCIIFFKFVMNNLDYYYFEFANNTEREIEVNVEYYYIKDGSFSKRIPPFSEIEFKVNSVTREAATLKVLDLDNEENMDYYLTMGRSFFFKTKFRLEYDGEKINTIYAHKIDYWF